MQTREEQARDPIPAQLCHELHTQPQLLNDYNPALGTVPYMQKVNIEMNNDHSLLKY